VFFFIARNTRLNWFAELLNAADV